RSEKDRRRTPQEIGFHSIRGGTVVGEHEVRFLGTDEELSILHRATSKRVFANGAIRAADFLLRHPNGLYSMDDLVKELLNK
ncbi:MAG: 4-hydroxy-tetrahydrodipicolinate reductase, partial [Clostridia bacterium]|nr:4-hydroxy-tetrahydrodipicolinate reductase [Clostridia bacterium]